jgi:hypothetical protein
LSDLYAPEAPVTVVVVSAPQAAPVKPKSN